MRLWSAQGRKAEEIQKKVAPVDEAALLTVCEPLSEFEVFLSESEVFLSLIVMAVENRSKSLRR